MLQCLLAGQNYVCNSGTNAARSCVLPGTGCPFLCFISNLSSSCCILSGSGEHGEVHSSLMGFLAPGARNLLTDFKGYIY